MVFSKQFTFGVVGGSKRGTPAYVPVISFNRFMNHMQSEHIYTRHHQKLVAT